MIVYVVTSGEYSDYHIDAIFSTKEKAEEYIKIHARYNQGYYSDRAGIEEWEMDKNNSIPTMRAEYYTVSQKIDFNLVSDYIEDKMRNCCYSMKSEPEKVFICTVHYHVDEEVMKKAVRDRYAQFMAQQEGI